MPDKPVDLKAIWATMKANKSTEPQTDAAIETPQDNREIKKKCMVSKFSLFQKSIKSFY